MGNNVMALVEHKHEKKPNVDNHNTLPAQFARWFYEETRTGNILSHKRCISYIQRLRNGAAVTDGNLGSFIAGAKKYLETHRNCTIKNVHGEGWRIATPQEAGIIAGQCMNNTMAWAERTMRVLGIVEPRYMPYARNEVYKRAAKKIGGLAGDRPNFSAVLVEVMDKYKEQNQHAIEAK